MRGAAELGVDLGRVGIECDHDTLCKIAKLKKINENKKRGLCQL